MVLIVLFVHGLVTCYKTIPYLIVGLWTPFREKVPFLQKFERLLIFLFCCIYLFAIEIQIMTDWIRILLYVKIRLMFLV